MTDIISIGFSVDTSQIATGQKRMESLGSTADKTASKTTAALGGMGRTAGQAGIQIQQLVGQIQMGTSPMVALSQQAADLGFVLGVPLLGAIAGIAASFGSVLLPTLFESDDAVKKLKDTMESLDKVATQTAGGTYTLSAEIARLAKVSETAANAQIALSITEATQAINMARDSANDAIESFDDLFNGFDVVSTPETLNKLNEAMVRTGKSAVDLLNNTNLYATGLTQLKSFSDSLSGSLGTTTEDSIKLIKAVSDFRQGGSISQLAETFSNISLSTNGATKEFQALAVNLNNLSLTTEKSEAVLDLLKNTLGDLGEIMANSDSVVNEVINSYRMKTDALSADETQMAKNIAIQTIGINATEQEKEAVLQAVEAYYQKLNAIKAEEEAQKNANKEREKAAKLAQKEADLAFKFLISGQDKVSSRALREANEYDKWIESIDTTSTRMAALREEIEKTQAAIEAGDLSESVGSEYIADLEKQIKSLDTNPFQSMTDGAQDALQAMSGMFENGSKDAKKLAIAMQALNLVQAVGAVLNQGTGDPYTAFGRMAAMAAMVASLGMSIGNLNGGIEDKSAEIQANQGLNQWGEQADGITTATEETAAATKKLVGINTDMLSALENLSMALSSASGLIAGGVEFPSLNIDKFDFAKLDLINTVIPDLVSNIDIFSNITQAIPRFISKTVGKLFGGSSDMTNQGIQIIGGTISGLISNTIIQAFTEVTTSGGWFRKGGVYRNYAQLGDGIGQQISLVFGGIADSVTAGAEILGLSQAQINNAINSFQIATQEISLKGMDTDEQQKAIEAYFSNVFNNLAGAVVPFLGEFTQAGEELSETLSRLATEVSVAEYLIDNFGVRFADKFADPKAFAKAADNLATLAGGVENLADQVSSFTDAFASDSVKFDIYQKAVTSALEDVGLSLPATADGMWELMSSLDATTEAGQKQIATLLGITDTADAYYGMLDKITDKITSALETLLGRSESFAKTTYETAKRYLGAQLASGQLNVSDAFYDALDGITSATEDMFSSAAEFAYENAVSANILKGLSDLTGGQLSIEEQQLQYLEIIASNTSSNNASVMLAGSETVAYDSSTLVEEVVSMKNQMVSLMQQMNLKTDKIESNVSRIRLNSDDQLQIAADGL